MNVSVNSEHVRELEAIEATMRDAQAVATPCPVDWCERAGRHLFDDQDPRDDSTEHARHCERETLVLAGPDDVWVGAFHRVAPDGPVRGVELTVTPILELTSPEAVRSFIDAVERAAALAFGTPTGA